MNAKNVDAKLLKAILSSSESVAKELENAEEYQYLVKEEKFLPSPKILQGLCTSLTKLLSYKVSQEAYQRYAVKINVIELIRDWCRINDTLKDYYIFKDEKNTLKFTENLLEKYLSKNILDCCDSNEDLLPLTSALICLSYTNTTYKCHLEKLLLKVIELKSTEESDRLLCSVITNNSDLNLELATIESIYVSQKQKLIEQPLLNNFMLSCNGLKMDENVDQLKNENLVKQLLEFLVKSPYIFLLVCAFLKELFIRLNHSPMVMEFIKSTLERIKKCCESQGKDILDLYPRNLQSTVILLRIEPTCHTENSKSSTLKTLEGIYTDDKNIVTMLLLHFPQWLKLFAKHILTSDTVL